MLLNIMAHLQFEEGGGGQLFMAGYSFFFWCNLVEVLYFSIFLFV